MQGLIISGSEDIFELLARLSESRCVIKIDPSGGVPFSVEFRSVDERGFEVCANEKMVPSDLANRSHFDFLIYLINHGVRFRAELLSIERNDGEVRMRFESPCRAEFGPARSQSRMKVPAGLDFVARLKFGETTAGIRIIDASPSGFRAQIPMSLVTAASGGNSATFEVISPVGVGRYRAVVMWQREDEVGLLIPSLRDVPTEGSEEVWFKFLHWLFVDSLLSESSDSRKTG